MFHSNTKIPYGNLKKSHLEKFLEAYKKIGLNFTSTMPSINLINEDNKNLKRSEITPSPFEERDNKLIIGVRNHQDGNLYVHAEIILGEDSIKNSEELIQNYDEAIRHYRLR